LGGFKIKKKIGFKLLILTFFLVLTVCSCSATTINNSTNTSINSSYQPTSSNTTLPNTGVKLSQKIVGDNENSQSDMIITYTTSNQKPNYLKNIYLTIKATNNGPNTSNDNRIFYRLDNHLTWISDDSNNYYDKSNGIWYIGTVNNGSSKTLNIIARVTSYNTNFSTNATLQSGSSEDPNQSNNIAYVNFTLPPTSDLTVTQKFSSNKVNYLHYFMITVNVKNNGPNIVNNVTVNCYLNPKVLRFSSCNHNNSYNSSSGMWIVGSMNPGSQSVLRIWTKLLAFNKWIATSAKSSSVTYDYNQSNNVARTALHSPSLTIRLLANDLRFGTTSKRALATNIVNWVRDNIQYSFYYNTKYGASRTLKLLKGNCADTAHLVVALARVSGLAARYKHGTCHFIESGHWYGHVWANIYVNKKWYSADATGYKNTLGVIKNWDTSTYKLHGTYTTLPF
jgi:hypothetical protein